MNKIRISINNQRKLASAVISGCERANRITDENVELMLFCRNIRGHIRTSACVPFMFQRYFGAAVKRLDNSGSTYEYVAVELEGYLIKIAHEPSNYAEYREAYYNDLFPEFEQTQKTLTLRYRTDSSNRVTSIWLENDSAILPLPIDLVPPCEEDQFYEAKEEMGQKFEPVVEKAEAR